MCERKVVQTPTEDFEDVGADTHRQSLLTQHCSKHQIQTQSHAPAQTNTGLEWFTQYPVQDY